MRPGSRASSNIADFSELWLAATEYSLTDICCPPPMVELAVVSTRTPYSQLPLLLQETAEGPWDLFSCLYWEELILNIERGTTFRRLSVPNPRNSVPNAILNAFPTCAPASFRNASVAPCRQMPND